MSGIVGIVNFDGAPVDRDLLTRMTTFMAFRGPDAQQVWHNGNVGFGHTLLRTTDESEHERQPLTLDGHLWIVADARVDARSELIPLLQAKGHPDLVTSAPDVELILRAYQVWGEDCVERLLGDFAFAIWDSSRERLFCARDHMGVKPFFYAHLGQTLIFSNTLDCIRQYPAMSDTLNDSAIADFLLFEVNQDAATTSFADVQRLPPAHRATWCADRFVLTRYWMVPIDEPIYYRRRVEYIERLSELLKLAVGDRLRSKRVGVLMSGGLDSSSLAATACSLLPDQRDESGIRAFTSVYDRVIPDEERYYASLVAKYLGIQIHFQVRDDEAYDQIQTLRTPEPVVFPFSLTAVRGYYKEMSRWSRVLYFGEGSDDALRFEWKSYCAYLASTGRWFRFLLDGVSDSITQRRLPLVHFISGMIRKSYPTSRGTQQFPEWLSEDLVTRLGLRQRWVNFFEPQPSIHPIRPKSYRSFVGPTWSNMFAGFDCAFTQAPLDVRHPFLDTRLLRYLLSVPVFPWCRSKQLLRAAMRSKLPDEILRRPKVPLPGDPDRQRVCRLGIPRLTSSAELRRYVICERVPQHLGDSSQEFWTNLRPFSLGCWFDNSLRSVPCSMARS